MLVYESRQTLAESTRGQGVLLRIYNCMIPPYSHYLVFTGSTKGFAFLLKTKTKKVP